jgi:hypothetical protein
MNQVITDEMILSGGQPIKFANFFGIIRIMRYKPKRKIVNGKVQGPVNWAKTKQYRKEGKIAQDKVIFSNNPFSYKFVWSGKSFMGSSAYAFKPSRTNGTDSNTGLVNKLIRFITENDTNYLKFPLN